MGIIAVRCPQCGADVQLDESREFGFCTYCGTKIMQEKIFVEHNGSVKIDSSEELKNLYIAARNSIEAGDKDTALEYYRKIAMIDPNSWEPLFYSVTLGLNNIKNSEIQSAATRIANCLPKVFKLISEYVNDENEKVLAVEKVINECYNKSLWLISASHSFHQKLTKGNGTIAVLGAQSVVGGLAQGFGSLALNGVGTLAKSAATSVTRTGEDIDRCLHIASLMKSCGDNIKAVFGVENSEYERLFLLCWKAYLKLGTEHGGMDNRTQNEISTMIHHYDPTFEIIEKDKSTLRQDKMTDMGKELQKTVGENPTFGTAYKATLKMLWKKIPKGVLVGIVVAYVLLMIIIFSALE